MRDGDADRRAVGDRLDDARELRFRHKARDVAFRVAHGAPLRRDDIFRHETLRQVLIHRDGAREVACAGVRNAEQVERGLHAAILAAGAVQRQKYDVRLGTHIEHTGTEKALALVLAARAHSGEVGLRLGDGIVAAEAVRCVENIFELTVVVLKAHEHIPQNGLMPARTQRAADLVAARERHIALHTQPTC